MISEVFQPVSARILRRAWWAFLLILPLMMCVLFAAMPPVYTLCIRGSSPEYRAYTPTGGAEPAPHPQKALSQPPTPKGHPSTQRPLNGPQRPHTAPQQDVYAQPPENGGHLQGRRAFMVLPGHGFSTGVGELSTGSGDPTFPRYSGEVGPKLVRKRRTVVVCKHIATGHPVLWLVWKDCRHGCLHVHCS